MSLEALEQAITFLSRTDLIVTARQQPMPAGVTEILKISSGDHEALLAAQEISRQSQEDVRHAAEFYVQQILFAPDGDHYRVLGVDPDDVEAKIKLHYRLLVRWLHPDKNSSDWEVVFADRINKAWQALRTPERRREYDEQLAMQPRQTTADFSTREVQPAKWRDNSADARFLSSRAIKRLPIAVFSLLGVAAVLALVWFSQMQPNLRPTKTDDAVAALSPTIVPAPESIPPLSPEVVDVTSNESVEASVSTASQKPEIKPAIAAAPAPSIAKAVPTVAVKITPMAAVAKTSVPAPKMPRPTPQVKTPTLTPETTNLTIASQETPKGKRKRGNRNKPVENAPEVASVAASSNEQPNTPTVVKASADSASDIAVKQFIQQFSRVYADGDYFALHNLFTRDLKIVGAPPQRVVLHSYRDLFENSQSRQIEINHITWLASDDNITVIASYQAQVVPRGKSETELSRGDIRLDLRMENGQLRIIRLQSDIKNG